MAFLTVRGRDGAEGVMEEASAYLRDVSDVVATRSVTAGLRAYLMTVRLQAQQSAPAEFFKRPQGYYLKVKRTATGAQGTLVPAGYGRYLETGTAGHLSPISARVGTTGNVSPGLLAWLRTHNPQLAARLAQGKAIWVKGRPASPWVEAAADQAEEAAAAAFAGAVLDEVGKVALQ